MDDTEFNPFWMIIREDGAGESRVRHRSEEDALAEAQRLTVRHGVNFIVMGSVARVRVERYPIKIDYPAGSNQK